MNPFETDVVLLANLLATLDDEAHALTRLDSSALVACQGRKAELLEAHASHAVSRGAVRPDAETCAQLAELGRRIHRAQSRNAAFARSGSALVEAARNALLGRLALATGQGNDPYDARGRLPVVAPGALLAGRG